MKAIIGVIVMTTVLIVGSPLAIGQTPATPAATPETSDQEFNFEGDEIRTDFLKPNTLIVEGLRRGRMSVLISVRLDFVDEIVKSAEDI
jgi:hypothetical protein